MRIFESVAATLLTWGPAGVFLLAALDSGGVPIPVGVDALVAAVAARDAQVGVFSAGLAVLGSALGCLFLYQLGRKGGQAYVDRKARGHTRAARFRHWFHQYGLLTVFIPALIPAPLPTKVFVLLAGAMGVRRTAFLLTVLAARIPRYFGMAWLGSRLGRGPTEFFRDHGWVLAGGAVALFFALAALVKLTSRLRARSTITDSDDASAYPS